MILQPFGIIYALIVRIWNVIFEVLQSHLVSSSTSQRRLPGTEEWLLLSPYSPRALVREMSSNPLQNPRDNPDLFTEEKPSSRAKHSVTLMSNNMMTETHAKTGTCQSGDTEVDTTARI